MSLRRTALSRKSELRRQSELRRTPLARKKEFRARSVKAARPRDTGPTPAQRNLVLDRAAACCELCGQPLHDGYEWVADHSFHHRQARGMGGSTRPEVNSPANVMLLCGSGTTDCHGFIESHRADAEANGWLVRHGCDPATTPVTVDRHATPVLLTDAGDYREVRP